MKSSYIRKLIRDLPQATETKASQRRRRVEIKKLNEILAECLRKEAYKAAKSAERSLIYRHDAAVDAWQILLNAAKSHEIARNEYITATCPPESKDWHNVPTPPRKPRDLTEFAATSNALVKATEWFGQARESLRSATKSLTEAAKNVEKHGKTVAPGIRGLASAIRNGLKIPYKQSAWEDGFEHTLVRQNIAWGYLARAKNGSARKTLSEIVLAHDRQPRTRPGKTLRDTLHLAVCAKFGQIVKNATKSSTYNAESIGRYLLLRRMLGHDPLAYRKLFERAFPSISEFESGGFICSLSQPAYLTPVTDDEGNPYPEQPVRYRYTWHSDKHEGWLYVFPANARNVRPRGLHLPDGSQSDDLDTTLAAWRIGSSRSEIDAKNRENRRLAKWWSCRNELITWRDSRQAGNCAVGTASLLRRLGLASSGQRINDDNPPEPILVRTVFKAAKRAGLAKYHLILSALDVVASRTGH